MVRVYTIQLAPVTKKNSSQIVMAHGHPCIIPSKRYKEYEKDCAPFLRSEYPPITEPVNVECKFYMPTRRRVDISNLISCSHDVLVHYGILADDNRDIVFSVDGSRVLYDKENPRTEIVISSINEEFERFGKDEEKHNPKRR